MTLVSQIFSSISTHHKVSLMFFGNKKIFCIGFNKTGTTSLHHFFQGCNLKSTHNPHWVNFTKYRFGKPYFWRYQCYCDGEQSDFFRLHRWFPDSLFILNDRNEKDWLYSRIKHVMRHNEDIDINTVLSSPKYGKMARDFYTDEESVITKWIVERKVFTKQAELYFRGKKNFRKLNIGQDKDWPDGLLGFFRQNGFRVDFKGNSEELHKGKRSKDDLPNQELLEEYLKIADEKLSIH